MVNSHESKRQRYSEEDSELLGKIESQDITDVTFREKLAQHVEQVLSVLFYQLHFKNIFERKVSLLLYALQKLM